MSELGQFLERFYGPTPTFRTVQARVRHTKQSARPRASGGREREIGRRRSDLPADAEREDILELWGSPPDCVRLQANRSKDGQTETSIEVVNGDDAWKRHPDGTVEHDRPGRKRSKGRHWLPTEYQRHFDRALIRECFAALTLEFAGTCEIAGRRCLKIRAVKVPSAQLWPHWFAWEATEFELTADLERATLLSIVGFVDGVAVETHEVVQVSYDGELEPTLFIYEPNPGESIQAAVPVAERVTWDAAVERASFKLLRPAYLPEGQKGMEEVMYHPARPRSPNAHVTIFYSGDRSAGALWITQQGERDLREHERLAWDEISFDGRTFEVSDPGTDNGLRLLSFEQGGTYVLITSDLPTEELVKTAGSMTSA